jgi:F-type H+-transporting ATPase subunit delta
MRTTKRARRAARQLYRLCLVDGALDETRARQVAQGLAASGRRGALGILMDFQRLVRLDRDRHTARVESATPLGGPLREAIQARLAKTYGPRLATSFEEDPALIGGIRIKVGTDVYDGSVRGRLNALAGRL